MGGRGGAIGPGASGGIFQCPQSFRGVHARADQHQQGCAGSIFQFSRAEMLQIFGPSPIGSNHDVLAVAARAKAAGRVPRLYLDCGTEDYLLDANRSFIATFDEMRVPHTYKEFPGDARVGLLGSAHPEAIAFHLNQPWT